ncbi:MAG: alpha/beta hydrolase [Pseudomonadota bacterium]|nr:alpha/beta hydrolase [Pseudomonadota bacterium]
MEQQPVLVFLRGLIRSRFHWLDFPQRFSDRYRVLTPELAGNGFRYNEPTPVSIREMMEDVRRQVRSQTEQPISIVAVSMGAMIASEWARCYPMEVRELHLINTSLANISSPWERMTALSFLRLLACFGNPPRLERTIFELTINRPVTSTETQPWLTFAQQHPLSWRNVFGQLIAASRYKGPLTAPVDHVVFYNAAQDRLVRPLCTARIATNWKKPLITHPNAGHDLPADEPEWLENALKQHLLDLK